MPRVNIITEGSSEETFVRVVLAPHLGARGVYATARSVETARKGSAIFRGGLRDYDRVKRDIQRWLKQDPRAYVSTMFDVYGLPDNFPGFGSKQPDPQAQVRSLEQAFKESVNDWRFIPYLQLYEFEALLFSDTEAIDAEFRSPNRKSKLSELNHICDLFPTPEHIDDSYATCPSRRLTALFPEYQKITNGSSIAARIGVESMRARCLHFGEWLTKIESLGAID